MSTETRKDDETRTPMPLERLARQVFDDSSDYDDGVGGWTKASFDPKTGVLVVSYERDEDIDPDFAETDEDYGHGSAEYRFRHVPDRRIVIPAPVVAFMGEGETTAMRCREVAASIEAGTLPGKASRDMIARTLRLCAEAMEGSR